jgi:hypothetical protein
VQRAGRPDCNVGPRSARVKRRGPIQASSTPVAHVVCVAWQHGVGQPFRCDVEPALTRR